MPTPADNARRWGHRCLLATELIVVVLLVMGGCYSKQNYHVLSAQSGDELLNKCNVVVEGQIVYGRHRSLRRWQEVVFFCWPYLGDERGPSRYDVFIDIDTVLKGDQNMPRRLQVDNCRPLTAEESVIFSQAFFPNNSRVRIGYNHKFGNTFRNLTVVALETPPPVTQPHGLIPTPPGAR